MSGPGRTEQRDEAWGRWLGGLAWGAAALAGLWWGAGWLAESDGPAEVPFAVHRLDMAIVGTVVGVLGVMVEARRRKRRRSLQEMMVRAVGIRLALLVTGVLLLLAGDALHSRDYWDYSVLSTGFHLLGPARMMAEQSLVLSGLGLCCTGEVINHLLAQLLGGTAGIYLLVGGDVAVLTLLGMAGERGLPPFRVFQVVSRIGLTTAVFSIPLAVYGGRLGYWGAEPFAWFFSLLALVMLVSAATRRW